jgi:hypothetical protein
MIRDLVRTACGIIAMSVAASLVIETRFQLASIDAAHRQTAMPVAVTPPPGPAPAPAPPGRLRAVGRAILDLADAGLGVVR